MQEFYDKQMTYFIFIFIAVNELLTFKVEAYFSRHSVFLVKHSIFTVEIKKIPVRLQPH